MKETINLVVLALENITPREPVDKEYVDYDVLKNQLVGKCASCKWTVLCYENYCSHCGQKLDWK